MKAVESEVESFKKIKIAFLTTSGGVRAAQTYRHLDS